MPTQSEHIVTTSLADEIAFRLQRKILKGDYQPGSRLVQDELCQIFGVSRSHTDPGSTEKASGTASC